MNIGNKKCRDKLNQIQFQRDPLILGTKDKNIK